MYNVGPVNNLTIRHIKKEMTLAYTECSWLKLCISKFGLSAFQRGPTTETIFIKRIRNIKKIKKNRKLVPNRTKLMPWYHKNTHSYLILFRSKYVV